MNAEKYIVRLSDEERQKLETIVKKLKGTSQKVNRALALLHADANGPDWTNEQITQRTGLTARAITNIRKQLVTEGFEAVLHRKQRRSSAVPQKLDGLQ
ncbi:MAG: helix-turn-helix domain-containing protein [Planctomycetaceae bacterium]|nr:helix-turn-helix domain-containing protein [Planctomycetaceae bacterium]